MIIVFLSQQLGNQMFQYALGKRLEMLGREVKYCTSHYGRRPEHDFALPRLFDLDIPEATETDFQTIQAARRRLHHRVERKLFGLDRLQVQELSQKYCVLPFNSRVLAMRQGILKGYWQSEKYFLPIADMIRKLYVFLKPSPENEALAEEMESHMSVSIHVRRGDYEGVFPLLTETYYRPAMQYFNEKYGSVRFYVFSNDIPWCREHLAAENVSFVDGNTGMDSPYDMWLMSRCKHNIIANSSFSWWGAWLNEHEGKIVIAPQSWDFYAQHHSDIYCPGWIVLSSLEYGNCN